MEFRDRLSMRFVNRRFLPTVMKDARDERKFTPLETERYLHETAISASYALDRTPTAWDLISSDRLIPPLLCAIIPAIYDGQ